MRQMILPGEKGPGALAKHAKKIFLATKIALMLSGSSDHGQDAQQAADEA